MRQQLRTPSSLHCFSVGCRPPSKTTSPRRTTQRRRRWRHTSIFSGTPEILRLSPLLPSHSPPFQFAPLRLGRAALLTAATGCPIAAADVSRPAAPHLDARTAGLAAPATDCAATTGGTATRPTTAEAIASFRKTRSLPWAAQRSRQPHLSSGFGFQTTISGRHRCRCLSFSTQVYNSHFRSAFFWRRCQTNFIMGEGY